MNHTRETMTTDITRTMSIVGPGAYDVEGILNSVTGRHGVCNIFQAMTVGEYVALCEPHMVG